MENNTGLLIVGLVISILLILVGSIRIKKSRPIAGMSRKKSNFIELLISGEASGIGQLVGGIVLLIAIIIGLFIGL